MSIETDLDQLTALEDMLKNTPIEEIKQSANYIFNRICLNIEKIMGSEDEALLPRYDALLKQLEAMVLPPKPTVIYIFNRAGITDILRGAMGVYKMCKILDYHFKIYIKKPFILEDYLVPNKYTWTISNEEYEKAVTENKTLSFGLRIDHNTMRELLTKECEGKQYVFVNARPLSIVSMEEYGQVYDELFKPSPELQSAINFHLDKLRSPVEGQHIASVPEPRTPNTDNRDFVSASFRFQQLLGDFKDGDYPTLSLDEQKVFIAQNIDHLKEISQLNPGKKVFVATDSITFLKEAEKLDFTYVIIEKIAHPSYYSSDDANKDAWMKIFLDYFIVKHAKRVYLIVDGLMYTSTFPIMAAKHGKNSQITINYNEVRFSNATKELNQLLYQPSLLSQVGVGGGTPNEKETLTQKTLACFLPATIDLWCQSTGLDVYNKLADEESKTIYKELFYHHHIAKGNWFETSRYHYSNILKTTLINRLTEKGKDLSDYHQYDDAFFIGNKYFDLPAFKVPPAPSGGGRGGDTSAEVFVDVGAYQGESIQGFVDWCGGDYKHIYAFEPNPDSYQILTENIKKWDLDNITLIQKGLHDQNTPMRFSGSGSGFMINPHSGNKVAPVMRMDSYFVNNEPITFLKIDVVGAEKYVLLAARNTIQRCKPKIAIAIYHSPKEDMINLPAFLLKLVPEYKFNLRHYGFSTTGTILYATT